MFTLLHRFLVGAETLETVRQACEPTEDYVWVGSKGSRGPLSKQRLRRMTLRGVPANHVDFAVLEAVRPDVPFCVEIGEKTGKFDNKKRMQIVVRHWAAGERQPLPNGKLRLVIEEDETVLRSPDTMDQPAVARWYVLSAIWHPRSVVFPKTELKPLRTVNLDGGSWIGTYPCLPDVVGDPDSLKAIVLWHWKHYYRVPLPLVHSDNTDVTECILEFEATIRPRIEQGGVGLAEANRIASRLLYHAARRNGWRKLTLRERKSFGFDSSWVHESKIQKRLLEFAPGSPAGVGQYTHEAAAGKEMVLPSQACPECHLMASLCECR